MKILKGKKEAITKNEIIQSVVLNGLRNESEIAESLGYSKSIIAFNIAEIIRDNKLSTRKRPKGSDHFDLYANEWTEGFIQQGGYLSLFKHKLNSYLVKLISSIISIVAVIISGWALVNSNNALDISESNYNAERTLVLTGEYITASGVSVRPLGTAIIPQELKVYFPSDFNIDPKLLDHNDPYLELQSISRSLLNDSTFDSLQKIQVPIIIAAVYVAKGSRYLDFSIYYLSFLSDMRTLSSRYGPQRILMLSSLTFLDRLKSEDLKIKVVNTNQIIDSNFESDFNTLLDRIWNEQIP